MHNKHQISEYDSQENSYRQVGRRQRYLSSTSLRSSITRKCHRRCHMYYYWRPSVSTGGTCIKYGSGVCGAWLTSPQCDSHHVYIREHHKRSLQSNYNYPHFLVSNLTQVCKAFFSSFLKKVLRSQKRSNYPVIQNTKTCCLRSTC